MMSALTPKADIGQRKRNVRFVPKADIASGNLFWNCSRTDHSFVWPFRSARKSPVPQPVGVLWSWCDGVCNKRAEFFL